MGFKGWFDLLKAAISDFGKDECPRLAAALAYYTVFSLPPLLIIIMSIAGTLWSAGEVQGAIEGQLGEMLGERGAQGVQTIMTEAERPERGSVAEMALGLGALLFGATGAFFQLQHALNRAWGVQPDPAQGGIRTFIVKRILSLGMIFVIAFLLLVSLAVSALLSAFGDALSARLPGVGEPVLYAFNLAVSFAIITALFAGIFKYLPDAKIDWSDVWVGAVVTSVLFVTGKFAIGFYLGQSEVGSAYGAAGSLVVILLWVYYAAMIVLFGAEFTQTWAERRGSGIRPENGAARVEEKKELVRGPEEQRRAEEKAAKEGKKPPPERERIDS